ncbi:23S rRNA (guanosine(2251)-2'-O)-methyltransferase RlmB [Marinilabilia salmonicolor]|jgi:23S rRNA (guanosine2251-2'-O)-methyltransferase|uniref:23S rRNA (Guanosine2251-2'-O)-methyltransferase n=1 Tax=Marinilabilia salmonicolor TaxID=989 RepID=A0A2T0XH71_9BACT|nr:23S rRNA (guanosine(2251)-2'-O)-methyltransferase RlmB [Marinilabilia salmonicolor]PRY98247.1 23S rRNA (guanosine2251-2'-O)-methyltransferase [Marinilabilia salmonicolor]RCW29211.1 23S rRNA (guanosine2251-2'-O)-methyltransferase [Marinilabilia salmonicolor]
MAKEIIYGIRAVMEAIQGGRDIERVLISENLKGNLAKELQDLIREKDITFKKVKPERIDWATKNNHQGVVAYLPPVEYHNIEKVVEDLLEQGKEPFVLILDGITDVRNFGAIARTAECAGVDAIVLPEKGSVSVTSDAIKTSAGALFRVPVCREKNLYYVLRHLKDRKFTIAAASEKGDIDYRKADYKGAVALIMGAEDKGVSGQLLKLADAHVSIPIRGEIGSLNVSVAAGVLIYEVLRHRD